MSNRDHHSGMPKVNVGLPVYNGEAYLEKALDSLLAQTFEDFELIISDNASTDGTEEICRSYAERDARIRYRRQVENQGAIWNFNEVFRLSQSLYFKWAASDDVCSPSFMRSCVDLLDHDGSIAWCHTRSRHIDPDGQPLLEANGENISYATAHIGERALPFSRESSLPHQRFQAVLLAEGGCLDSYGLIRSEIIRKTPLYLPHYGAEKVFIAELAVRGRFREIPQTLFFPRVHDRAAGHMRSAAEQQDYMNPKGRRRFSLTRIRLLKGYISAVVRADLATVERIRCLQVILRYLLQVEKWTGIVIKTMAGSGLGGEDTSLGRHIKRLSGHEVEL